MTKFDTLDKMTTNVVTLTDQELMEVEGGIADWVVYGGVAIIAIGVGWWLGK